MRAFLKTLPRQLLSFLLVEYVVTYAIVHLDGYVDNLPSMLMSIHTEKKKVGISYIGQDFRGFACAYAIPKGVENTMDGGCVISLSSVSPRLSYSLRRPFVRVQASLLIDSDNLRDGDSVSPPAGEVDSCGCRRIDKGSEWHLGSHWS